jgi:O-antigen/teichoic acid export membrane protein
VTFKVTNPVPSGSGPEQAATIDRGADSQWEDSDAGKPSITHSELGQKALRAAFWSGVCVWGNRALTFVFLAVLARLLGPQAFGVVALSTVYLGFLLIFQDQGFAHAVIQREDLHPDHLNTAFWLNVGLALVLTLATWWVAPWGGRLFHEPQLPGVMRGLSPLLVIGALTSVHRALLSRAFRFRALAVAALLGVMAGGMVGVLAALRGFGVWSLVFYQIVSRTCESCCIWWQSGWRPHLRWTRVHFLDLFGFGKYVVGGQLAAFVQLYAANLIIGLSLGSFAVGLFDVAYRCIHTLLQMISGVISRVSLPAFARLQQEPEAGRTAFLRATSLVALLCFPAFLAVAVLAPEIVRTIFGDQWERVIPAMRILSLAGVLQALYYLKRYLILAYGRPKWHFGLEVLTVVLTLAGVLLTVRAGIVAVAWAQVLAQLVSFPLLFLAVSKLVPIRLTDEGKALLPSAMASILATLAVFLLKMMLGGRAAPQIVLGAGLLVGAGIYLISLWVMDPSGLLRTGRYLRAMLDRTPCGETPGGLHHGTQIV